MPRKTAKLTEIRALTNRYLAGSDPELVEFRQGVAAMYEHLAMAANVYHGYNDIVQVWAGEPGQGTYVPDETYRRQYFGPVDGPDAQAAEDAIRAYRENSTDPELMRRRREASNIALDRAASGIAVGIIKTARESGDDPIAWVTGNSYMPPLRSFAAAEAVWQDDADGDDFAYLTELVEAKLSEANVALECPEYDNALYAVDLARFEYSESEDGETLQDDWQPRRTDAELERDRRAAAGDDQAQDAQYEAEHPTEVPPGIAPDPAGLSPEAREYADENWAAGRHGHPTEPWYDRELNAQLDPTPDQPHCCENCEGNHA